MIGRTSCPRLAARARLQYDRHSQRHLLLYPERGLTLNPSAVAIVRLCDGERSVAEIARRIAAQHVGATQEQVEGDVLAFLESLWQRGLVTVG